MSHGVGRRGSLDPTLLWLWHRPEAAAPIQPLAWEPPYAAGTALKRKKKMSLRGTGVEEWIRNEWLVETQIQLIP